MEHELEKARRAHAEMLSEAGTQPYPNDFRASEELMAQRREALLLLNDEDNKGVAAEGEELLRREGALLIVGREEGEAKRFPQDSELVGDEPVYPVFGRVMAKRGPFLVIQTPHGRAQAFIPDKGKHLEENARLQLKSLDLSDHVAIEGPLMGTRKGDSAVKVQSYRHVGKSLLPPPAKFQGLKDVEKRYRERYVDLFANPDVSRVFVARNLILRRLRSFLDERAFLEVETPLLHSLRGGATARPFSTHHNALDMPLFLRIAPELYLKRLLVGGFDRVYELGRNFRNEGLSTRHNPEFTMLEFYMAYATYEELLDLSEELIRSVDLGLKEHFGPSWQPERSFELEEPFARVQMVDAIAERVARSEDLGPTAFDGLLDRELLDSPKKLSLICDKVLAKSEGKRLDIAERKQLERAQTHGERIYALFEILAEPDLTALYRSADKSRSIPVFITHFPFEVSPLARRSDSDPNFTDRFELFLEGRELANAFSELNDPDDQAARFKGQLDNRERGDEEAMDFDADYIRALMHGMPPAAGLGLGVDRLCMALCAQSTIRDVLLFPLMRPEAG